MNEIIKNKLVKRFTNKSVNDFYVFFIPSASSAVRIQNYTNSKHGFVLIVKLLKPAM